MDCLIELDRSVNHIEHLSNLYMETSKGTQHHHAILAVKVFENSNDRLKAFLILLKKELNPKTGGYYIWQ